MKETYEYELYTNNFIKSVEVFWRDNDEEAMNKAHQVISDVNDYYKCALTVSVYKEVRTHDKGVLDIQFVKVGEVHREKTQ